MRALQQALRTITEQALATANERTHGEDSESLQGEGELFFQVSQRNLIVSLTELRALLEAEIAHLDHEHLPDGDFIVPLLQSFDPSADNEAMTKKLKTHHSNQLRKLSHMVEEQDELLAQNESKRHQTASIKESFSKVKIQLAANSSFMSQIENTHLDPILDRNVDLKELELATMTDSNLAKWTVEQFGKAQGDSSKLKTLKYEILTTLDRIKRTDS